MNPHYSEHPGYATFTLAQPFTVNLLNSSPTQFAMIMAAKQR